MVGVRTEIAGVALRNPTMLASGFLDETGGSMARVYQAGAGAVVTKSVGPQPREGYPNPTIVELDAGLLNAVGLPNPGVIEYEHEVKRAQAAGAVVIGSVYGKDADEYAAVAAKMSTYGVEAIELNLSCPHAKGRGTEIAQDEAAVRDFTREVKDVVDIPVFPKLSPNVQDIAKFAVAAEEGGADGIVAINTMKAMAITPELKMPSLANRFGGLSGPAIRPIGVRAVYDICEKVRIPRYDELPMALSHLGAVKGITVRDYGDATHALAAFTAGDRIGVRGPYGNAFQLEGPSVLAVGGGSGMASMIAAIEAFAQQGARVVTAVGARTAAELLFVERANAAGEIHIATDDGSRGSAGFVPALAEKLLSRESFAQVITCGPEKMMAAVVDLARQKGLPVQASLERYMKCGIGICDACALDDKLVCWDGPIFTGDQLAKSEEFGRYRRDKSGRRVPV